MTIKLEYKGYHFEFDALPAPELLEQAYRLREQDVQRQMNVGNQQVITRIPRDGHLPLSFAQQRLWFLEQMTPEIGVYNLCSATQLDGNLDLQALIKAIRKLAERHEVLRSRFPSIDGQPHVMVCEMIALPVI